MANWDDSYVQAERLVGINGTVAGQIKPFSADSYQKPLPPNPISTYVEVGMDALGMARYRTPLAVITEDHQPSGRRVPTDPAEVKTSFVNRFSRRIRQNDLPSTRNVSRERKPGMEIVHSDAVFRVEPNTASDYERDNPLLQLLGLVEQTQLATERQNYQVESLQYLVPYEFLSCTARRPGCGRAGPHPPGQQERLPEAEHPTLPQHGHHAGPRLGDRG